MKREISAAVLGFVLLLPAVLLVSSGLLGLEQPAVLVHPAVVMGGLVLALVVNAVPLIRVRFGQEEDTLVGSMVVRLRGTLLNLSALALGCLLLATVTGYLFVENFQAR